MEGIRQEDKNRAFLHSKATISRLYALAMEKGGASKLSREFAELHNVALHFLDCESQRELSNNLRSFTSKCERMRNRIAELESKKCARVALARCC